MFLIFVTVFCSTANAAQFTWKLGHNRPTTDKVQTNLEVFAKEVEQGTEGKIKIEIFPAGQLGGGDAIFEKVAMGSVEMFCSWPSTLLDDKLEVAIIPGFTSGWEDIAKMYATGSPFMNILEERYEKLGIKILGSYVQYLAGAAFVKEPEDVLNPYAKHTEKMRILNMRTHAHIWEGLGYRVTYIPYAEIVPATQTGIVDGVATIGAETTYILLRGIAKYWLPANTNLEAWFLCLNLDIWNSLTDEDQKVILCAAKKLEDKRFKEASEDMEYWENVLRKEGIHVFDMTDAQREAFQKRIREYVTPRLKQDFGEEFIERVVDAIKASLE